jgi:hypothetical protein
MLRCLWISTCALNAVTTSVFSKSTLKRIVPLRFPSKDFVQDRPWSNYYQSAVNASLNRGRKPLAQHQINRSHGVDLSAGRATGLLFWVPAIDIEVGPNGIVVRRIDEF